MPCFVKGWHNNRRSSPSELYIAHAVVLVIWITVYCSTSRCESSYFHCLSCSGDGIFLAGGVSHSLIKVYFLSFGGACCVHLEGDWIWFRWLPGGTFSGNVNPYPNQPRNFILCHSLYMFSDDACHLQRCFVERKQTFWSNDLPRIVSIKCTWNIQTVS
jgi:hypothetical protein